MESKKVVVKFAYQNPIGSITKTVRFNVCIPDTSFGIIFDEEYDQYSPKFSKEVPIDLDLLSQSEVSISVFFIEGKKTIIAGKASIRKDDLQKGSNEKIFSIKSASGEERGNLVMKVVDSREKIPLQKLEQIPVSESEVVNIRNDKVSKYEVYVKIKSELKLSPQFAKKNSMFALQVTLKFKEVQEDGRLEKIIYKSEIVSSNQLSFKHFYKKLLDLGYDEQSSLCFDILHKDQTNPNPVQITEMKQIGGGTKDIQSLIERKNLEIDLFNQSNTNIGKLALKLGIEEWPSFQDYIDDGVKFALIIGIDFTDSNGNREWSFGHHYNSPKGQENVYQKAIKSICNVLFEYDDDKRAPVYGFGAIPNFDNFKSKNVSHCFPLNGNEKDPYVEGTKGVLDAYKNAIQGNKLKFSYPTHFAQILKQGYDSAKEFKKTSKEYVILLIFTDGVVDDLDETVEILAKSVDLPLSVIIVGVGKADFTKMDILDGDEGLYYKDAIKVERDMVQFLSFDEVQNNADLLSKKVIEELPDQLLDYMIRINNKL